MTGPDLFIKIWVVYTVVSMITFIVLVIWTSANKNYSDEGRFKYIPFDDEKENTE